MPLTNHPRIAQGIQLRWSTSEFPEYIKNLLLTDRANRQGFTTIVLEYLADLQDQHAKEFPDFEPIDSIF